MRLRLHFMTCMLAALCACGGGSSPTASPSAMSSPDCHSANPSPSPTASASPSANPTPVSTPPYCQGIIEYQLPAGSGPTAMVAGESLPATPDDSYVWFTEPGIDSVGKISPFGVIKQMPLTRGGHPNSISSIEMGSGTLCCTEHYYLVTEPGLNQVAGIDGDGFPVPTANAGLKGIAGGGFVAAFTEYNANKIGFVNTLTVGTVEYALPSANSGPTAIAFENTGQGFWIAESLTNRLALFNLQTAQPTFSEYKVPTANAGVSAIAFGGGLGDAVFAEKAANKIGVVHLDGGITEHQIPTPNSGVNALVVDDSGNVWFTEPNVNRIAMMTSAGTFKEYPVPTANAGLAGISLGNRGTTLQSTGIPCCEDDRIWFTEKAANRIGVLSP